jgi:hypothetical protein
MRAPTIVATTTSRERSPGASSDLRLVRDARFAPIGLPLLARLLYCNTDGLEGPEDVEERHSAEKHLLRFFDL